MALLACIPYTTFFDSFPFASVVGEDCMSVAPSLNPGFVGSENKVVAILSAECFLRIMTPLSFLISVIFGPGTISLIKVEATVSIASMSRSVVSMRCK